MYCKHCYKMMDDGTDICPACGKSQKEKIKKPIGVFLRILLGIATWFASMIAIAVIGTILGLTESQGIIANLYSLTVVFVPVVVAVIVAARKKSKQAALPNSTTAKVVTAPDPVQLTSGPDHTTMDQTHAEPPHSEITGRMVPAVRSEDRAQSKNQMLTSATHKVTGIQYYMDNIMELASENLDYDLSKKELVDQGMIDERIWKYEFFVSNVELVPEPDNPEDPNAIKVIADGEQVGYIKKGSCSKVLKAIENGTIRKIDCDIGGGPYKVVYEEYDDEKERDVYELEKDETNFFVRLTVYEDAK